MKTQELKSEIGNILHNYSIPMEDRELVIEKVEELLASERAIVGNEFGREMSRELDGITKHIDSERDAIRQEIEALRVTADAEPDRVKRAYEAGLAHGLSQQPPVPPPAPIPAASGVSLSIPVIIGLGLVALAVVLVVNQLFSSKVEEKPKKRRTN